MAKCGNCGVEIDDKYKFCFACVQKMKADNQAVGAVNTPASDDLVKAIGAVNNNLYAIRTLLEFDLKKKYRMRLVWENKKFEVVK